MLPAHFLVPMGKPYCLPYNFLLHQNKKKSANAFATKFASMLSFALHDRVSNLVSPGAFYNLTMHQNAFAIGALLQTPLEELTVLPDPKLDLMGCFMTERREKDRKGK